LVYAVATLVASHSKPHLSVDGPPDNILDNLKCQRAANPNNADTANPSRRRDCRDRVALQIHDR
jgi:hypothetical protein